MKNKTINMCTNLLQSTPASSLWSQLCFPQALFGHWTIEVSVPTQLTSSSQICPVPFPYVALPWAVPPLKKTLLTYIENKISLSLSLSLSLFLSLSLSLSIYQFINLSIYLFLSVSVSVSLNINIYVYMCACLKIMRETVWVCFTKFISFCNQIPWVIFVQIIANNG